MSNVTIPAPIKPVIAAYVEDLQQLQPPIYGAYIYGSIALGAYEGEASDIDIVVVASGEYTREQASELEQMHSHLSRLYPLGKRFDAEYVPLLALGKALEPGARCPTYRDGHFSREGQADMNAVTLWMLHHCSIAVLGPEGAALPLRVTWEDVLETMRYNLSVYWHGKAQRPYLFLSSTWVEFAVSTLCRILATVEDGEIISKSAALDRCLSRVPVRYHRLIAEAARIRKGKGRTLYRVPLTRTRYTIDFLRYVQSTCEHTLSRTGR